MTRQRLGLVVAVILVGAGPAAAQFGRVGRLAARPGRPIGLPNPLSNPAFDWWYHHAPTYWNGSYWQVIPYPGGSPYPPYGYRPAGIPLAVPPGAGGMLGTMPAPPVSPVTGRPFTGSDIHVRTPTPTARLFIVGQEVPGSGLDRHISLPPQVDPAVTRQVAVTCNWTDAAGTPRSETRTVRLDGSAHGLVEFR